MSDAKMMGSVGKVGVAIMVSRVLGLIRDQVFAFFFGAGFLMDCFVMAFRIPNLLRDLFAEGALSSAFVTVFAKRRAREGDESAWQLARLVMTLQVMILAGIVLLGIVFAPQIVQLMAHGWRGDPSKMDLTIKLTRILFPFILFLGMAALTMGVLNAYGHFGLPASASSFFNLGSIVVGLGLAWLVDRSFGPAAMICMAIGTLVGGFLQWFVQVPALRSQGYRYRPAWNLQDSGLREILRLMAPTLVGASAVQINVMINSAFASELQHGSVSWLSYAFRLIQLPIGLFGVAISTVALPSLAVEATHANKDMFRQRMEGALKLNAALCIPAACGLALLSVPLVGMLFHLPGAKFDFHATLATAEVLRAYTLGLIGYASLKVLVAGFYALNRTWIPMGVSIGSILTTICLNWFFIHHTHFGAAGLALTTSLTALCSAGILLGMLTRWVGGLSRESWSALGRMVASAAVMSAVVILSNHAHGWLGVGDHFLGNLSRVVFGVGAGGLTYLLVARMLRVEEVMVAEETVLAKLGWKPKPGPKT